MHFRRSSSAFTATELLVSLACLSLLAAVVFPIISRARSRSDLQLCKSNLKQISHAIQLYAADHGDTLPAFNKSPTPGPWWYYKDQVKAYLNLSGPSSPKELVFACPRDRGYDSGPNSPFCKSQKHNFTSYVFNGVNLPGVPNVAGRKLVEIVNPAKTLSVMEWTAHAPLSWHHSLTGRKNTPFYNNAESVVGFVDGHVDFIPIYYDGVNAAFTRDPIAGYAYKFSGD